MKRVKKFKPSKPDGDGQIAYTGRSGICPVCGIDDIVYSASEPEGDCICYPAECANGHSFNEWYEMTFIESVTR
jgi:hypothetical protein